MALNFKNLSDKLQRLSKKVKAKDSEGEEVEIVDEGDNSDRTRTEQVDFSELKKTKPKLKSIHILIIVLLLLFLLIDDEWVGTKAPEVITTTVEQVNKRIKNSALGKKSIKEPVDANLEKVELDTENSINIENNGEASVSDIESGISNELNSANEQDMSISDDENLEKTQNDLSSEVIENTETTNTEIPPLTTSSEQTIEDVDTVNDTQEELPETIDMGSDSVEANNTNNISELSDQELLDKVNTGGPSEEEATFNESEVTQEIIAETGGTDKLLKQIEEELKQEKLLQKDLNYKIKNRPPPSYHLRGPALVRNCVNGHWACVDAPSFKQCKINLEWTKDKGKNIQCYPHQVYKTLKDCEMAQDEIMVDNLKSIEVCQY